MFFMGWIRGILSSTNLESRRQAAEAVRHVQLHADKTSSISMHLSRPSNI